MVKRIFKRVTSPASHKEVTVESGLKGIFNEVNADNVVKAMVTVTILTDEGTFSHIEYNIDNESDLCSRHGLVAECNFEEAAQGFYKVSQNNTITTVQDGNEVQVILGDPDNDVGFIFEEEEDS